MHRIVTSCKRDLLDIYKHAIEAVKPERLIKDCVKFTDGKLVVDDPVHPDVKPLEYDLNGLRVHVIGGGKCVLAMAKGLADLATKSQINSLFSHGCLSVPIHSKFAYERDDTCRNLLESLDITVKFGSEHNLPDENSVQATECILKKISEASEVDRRDGIRSLFIVLLSGGGSACLCGPKHISLVEKSRMIEKLVQRGADIVDLNIVRRCFSLVKGGNLSRHILKSNPNSQILSLILSDVINDPVEIIASGPTCLNLGELELRRSMTSVMEKYDIEVPLCPEEESMSDNIVRGSVQNKVIGNNQLALGALERKATQLGYNTAILGNDLCGTTTDVLKHFFCQVNNEAERSLILAGGESTVLKGPDETWGLGGRVQEMALDYMLHELGTESPRKDNPSVDMFLAASTDGQDGPTDVAGCFASVADWSLSRTFDLEGVIRAKKTHDSFNFWTKHRPDWLVKTGPSGTNVMDLYMLLKVREAQ